MLFEIGNVSKVVVQPALAASWRVTNGSLPCGGEAQNDGSQTKKGSMTMKTTARRNIVRGACLSLLALPVLFFLAFAGGSARGDSDSAALVGPTFIRGDVNGDNGVDISDAIACIGFLFLGAADPPCLSAADVNDDEMVDISDVIVLLSTLFAGGGALPPPGPSPGPDPTPGLGC
jgi:hypothetical protein